MSKEKSNKKTDKKKEPKEMYKIVITMGDLEFKSRGETIYEALANIPLEWNQIKNKCVLTISYGDKSFEKLFFIGQMRGILLNKIHKIKWANNFEFLLKNAT